MNGDVSNIIIRLPNGLIALQRRDAEAANYPNMLSFFGGFAEQGESPLMTASRELSEETSLIFNDSELCYICSFPRPRNPATKVHLYLLCVMNTNFNVYEGVGLESYLVQDIELRNDLVPTVRIGIEYVNQLTKAKKENALVSTN